MKTRIVLFFFMLATIYVNITCASVETLPNVAEEQQPSEYSDFTQIAYCEALDDSICMSPDSILAFEFPPEIQKFPKDLYIEGHIHIENDGFQPFSIWEFHISIVDDSNKVHTASFEMDNGYDDTNPFQPAVTLDPDGYVIIRFHSDLDPEASYVQALYFDYKPAEAEEYVRMVVTYTPTDFEQDDNSEDTIE